MNMHEMFVRDNDKATVQTCVCEDKKELGQHITEYDRELQNSGDI